jgi:cyclophilin family peptidyl-prolyl cis-trans isomerase
MNELVLGVKYRFFAAQCLLVLALGCGSSVQSPVPVSIGPGDSRDGQTADSDGTGEVGTLPASKYEEPLPLPVVVLDTSYGAIHVRLDREKAPITVDNYLNNYVDRGHYDGTIFHYVLPGKTVLGGGFDESLQLKPVRAQIVNEADNGLKNVRGTIGMSRDHDYADSATCQFYFNVADNESFDHTGRDTPEEFGYCVFGEVVSGMDVLDRIAQSSVHDTPQFTSTPVEPVVLKTVRRAK